MAEIETRELACTPIAGRFVSSLGHRHPTRCRKRVAYTRLVVSLVAACASGCASSQGNPFEEGDDGPGEVGLVVVNELTSTVTAYIQWRLGNPTRLAEIAGESSMMTSIPVRGQELRVFFVNSGRSPGDPQEPDYALADAGDRFRWVLRTDGSVFYLRIE